MYEYNVLELTVKPVDFEVDRIYYLQGMNYDLDSPIYNVLKCDAELMAKKIILHLKKNAGCHLTNGIKENRVFDFNIYRKENWAPPYIFNLWEEYLYLVVKELYDDGNVTKISIDKDCINSISFNYLVENFGEEYKGGYVYLMKDTTNGFTKIGYSKNPKYRERTLQSEKPTIELIYKRRGTLLDEKTLHKIFEAYRKRGEWFVLSDDQIDFIKSGLFIQL